MRPLGFLAYVLQDTNLQAILEDCLQELGTRTFPLSSSIRPNYSRVEEAFWRDKYNVRLIHEGRPPDYDDKQSQRTSKILRHAYNDIRSAVSERHGTQFESLEEYYKELGVPRPDEPVVVVRISKDGEVRFRVCSG